MKVQELLNKSHGKNNLSFKAIPIFTCISPLSEQMQHWQFFSLQMYHKEAAEKARIFIFLHGGPVSYQKDKHFHELWKYPSVYDKIQLSQLHVMIWHFTHLIFAENQQ